MVRGGHGGGLGVVGKHKGLACDRFETRARAGGSREGAGRGAVVEAVL